MARHLLIAAGTSKYDNLGETDQRPQLIEAVSSVVGLFTKTLKHYERQLEAIARNPPAGKLRKSLDRWFAAQERDPSDWVVLYYTGHGEVVGSDSLYLLTSDFEPNLYAGTAFALRDLADMVLAKRSEMETRQVKNLLVIIDACFAGVGAVQLANDLAKTFRQTSQGMFYVLGAALPRQEAKAGALAKALVETIEDLSNRNVTQEFLFLDQIVPAINSRLRVHEAVLCSVTAPREVPQFFPNPHYVDTKGRPLLAADTRRAIADPRFRNRIASLAREGVFDNQALLLFSGRTAVLNKLRRFLTDANDYGTRIVTGGPGAGKSAILARILSLSTLENSQATSTAEERFDVPSIDLAIYAKGKSFAEVVDQIAEFVNSESSPDAILHGLRASSKSLRIIVDALDEAAQPSLIANRLLKPINAIATTKLLVGTRVKYARGLEATEIIDIDTPEHALRGDIAEYVEALLLRAGEPELSTPYEDHEKNAHRVAEIIADKAYPNYLVARLIAEDLLSRPEPLDPEEARRITFPTTVPAALEAFLARFGSNEVRLRDLLLPLAYAEGQGLPWDNIWAALAGALSGRTYRDPDVTWLLENAGSFVIESATNGRAVYRLFHRALGDTLRQGQDSLAVHHAFVSVLVASIPHLAGSLEPDWSLANQYIRSHLATHAALAEELDPLLTDPFFLVAADMERLIAQISTAKSEPAQAAAKAYLQAVHHFRAGHEDERIPYLDLAARQCGIEDFVKTRDSLPKVWPWRAVWAHWLPTEPFRTVAQHRDWVTAIVVANVNGRPIVATASRGGIKVTASSDGALLWERSDEPVTCLALTEIDDRPILVAGCDDGKLRLWNLAEGSPVGRVFGGHGGDDPAVRAVQTERLNGRTIVISGGNDGTIRLWDLELQEELFEPIKAFEGMIQDIVLGTINDRPVIVGAASGPHLLRIWDLFDRSLLHEFTAANLKCEWIRALAFGIERGRPVIVLATAESGVRIVDIQSGLSDPLPNSSTEAVDAVAIGTLNASLVIAADLLGPIGIWDLEQRRLLGRLLGHHHTITALTLGVVNDRMILVSGSFDRTVRIWDLEGALQWKAGPRQNLGGIQTVRIGKHHDRSIIVSTRIGPQVQLWELAQGTLLNSAAIPRWDAFDPEEFHDGDFPIALGTHEGRAFVALGGVNRSIFWDLVEIERWRQTSLRHEGEPLTAMEFGRWQGRKVLAMAHVARTNRNHAVVRFLDLNAQNFVTDPVELPGRIKSLALAACSEATFLLAASEGKIFVWNLDAQLQSTIIPPKDITITSALAAGAVEDKVIVVCGDYGGSVYVSNLKNDKGTRFRAHEQAVRAVAIARIGERPVIVSGGDDRVLGVSALDGSNLVRIDVDGVINDIAIGPLGEVVVGTYSGILMLQCQLDPLDRRA